MNLSFQQIYNGLNWVVENKCHHVIDWNFDEDRSRIHTGHGPENITRLRRFAVGGIQFISDGKDSVSMKNATVESKYSTGLRLSAHDF